MDNWFILKFAIRNLKLHRLRTVLTLFGIVISISAIVFLVSFAFGIEKLVTKEVTGGNAFLLLDVGTGNSQIVNLSESTMTSIKNINGVVNAYGITGVGGRVLKNDNSMDISFYGSDLDYLTKSGVNPVKGALLSEKGDEALVNSKILSFLGLTQNESIGKTINLDVVIPKEIIDKEENLTLNSQPFKIVGVINDDSAPKAYTNSSALKKLGVEKYNQAKVEVNSRDNIPEIRKQIENMGLKTQYVGDTVAGINQVFGVFRAVLASFGIITLIVAILGMFNTLTISLLERVKEIALMKMLGMKKKNIRSVFLFESITLGLFGGALGLFFGILFGKLANIVLNNYAITMGGESVTIFYYPITLIFSVIGLSFLVGLFTGIYPAWRALKVKSLDVLRYE